MVNWYVRKLSWKNFLPLRAPLEATADFVNHVLHKILAFSEKTRICSTLTACQSQTHFENEKLFCFLKSEWNNPLCNHCGLGRCLNITGSLVKSCFSSFRRRGKKSRDGVYLNRSFVLCITYWFSWNRTLANFPENFLENIDFFSSWHQCLKWQRIFHLLYENWWNFESNFYYSAFWK